MPAHDFRAAFSGQGVKRALERRRTLLASTIEVPRRAGTEWRRKERQRRPCGVDTPATLGRDRQLESGLALQEDTRVPVMSKPLTLTERMQRIRKSDTTPELIVRRMLHGMGFRYRLHDTRLPGTPDIVLPRHGKVVLAHGCFWHRHDCPDGRKLPRSKPEYWVPKLERNRARDASCLVQLRELGWDVLVVWECETRRASQLQETLQNFMASTAPTKSQQCQLER